METKMEPATPPRRAPWARAAPTADAAPRACSACMQQLPLEAFSRNQLAKPDAKCKACVAAALLAVQQQHLAPRLKRCVQCFQDLADAQFSKRQFAQLDGKCRACVAQLEREAARVHAPTDKWCYDQFYRCCHRGKTGGVGVRTKCNIASPLLGAIPLGRAFRATQVIFNEQGDPMVKLASLEAVQPVVPRGATADKRGTEAELVPSAATAEASAAPAMRPRDGWVPCRSIRNEVFIERHAGPWLATTEEPEAAAGSAASGPTVATRFYRCVIEGCKVRAAPDLALVELGYVLYGDVVEVVECRVDTDGVVFLRLHARYFDGPAWVVERTLDNESVLDRVPGPSRARAAYRCVQDGGAPTRREPSLAAPPVGRIPCGAVVTVLERVVTPERHVFLRLEGSPTATTKSRGSAPDDPSAPLWVIETSTVCASVMVRCREEEEDNDDGDYTLRPTTI